MKIDKRAMVYSGIIILLLLQVIMQSYISVFQYLDELIAIISLFYLIIYSSKYKIEKSIIINVGIMILLFAIGIAGNMYYEIQTNPKAIITDVGNMFKAFVTFFAFYIKFKHSDSDFKQKLILYLNIFCKIIILPGFMLAIINLVVNVGMHTEYVYGMRAFHYIFLRVGNLNSFCVRALMIMTLYLLENKNSTAQKIFILMTITLMIATLRTRAFLYIIIYIFAYLYLVKGKRIKVKPIYIAIVIVIGLYIAIPKIQFYFINSTKTARAVLVRYGVRTAIDSAPIGAGFGTYGTFAAKEYWSPLYDKYNFNNYHGLSSDWGAFLTDNYWPAILGEFGFTGAILFLLLIANIYKIIFINTKNKENVSNRFVALFGMLTISIASLVSCTFSHTSSIGIMILIALASTYNKRN